ncbi:hypothetical protein EDC96DRAFT_517622 [Choanephora cucurbitarum]|nr:hypothetical protein EDC96DRAFT_517622 [Choanephora cucurbitarum]
MCKSRSSNSLLFFFVFFGTDVLQRYFFITSGPMAYQFASLCVTDLLYNIILSFQGYK